MTTAIRHRSVASATIAAVVIAIATAALPSASHAALVDDFDARFMTVCAARGLTVARCRCTLEVIKDAIGDEHLDVMLAYFEDPDQIDDAMLAEFEIDEQKYQDLKDQIEGAVATARTQCRGV